MAGAIVGAFLLSLLAFLIFQGANPRSFPDPLGYFLLLFVFTIPLGGILGARLGYTIADYYSSDRPKR